MATQINALRASQIRDMVNNTDHRTVLDGRGLYFENRKGRARFFFRYRNEGELIDIALGKLVPISNINKKSADAKIKYQLEEVRQERDKFNIMRGKGKDPREERNKERNA